MIEQILIFIGGWAMLRSFFCTIIHDGKNDHSKIGGNMTSMINGFIMIFGALFLNPSTILSLNISYNIVDFINASLTFKIHHIAVILCDILILNNVRIQNHAMFAFAMIELSNYYIWLYYHKIHYFNFKPTSEDIKKQLICYTTFRTFGFCYGIWMCCAYSLVYEFILVILVGIGSVFWGVGMHKKYQSLRKRKY